MHSVAFTFAKDPDNPTEQEMKAAVDFFGSLKSLIPCRACANHYEKYLATHPVDASSREALSRWVYDLHSDVNRRKHAPNPSFEAVKQNYTGFQPGRDEMKLDSPWAVEKKMKELADPHFGKSLALHGENALASVPRSAMAAMISILVVGGVAAYFIFRAGKADSGEDKETKQK